MIELKTALTKQEKFPIDILPDSIKKAIKSIHLILQGESSLTICANSILSAINYTIQSEVDIEIEKGWKIPSSCYFLTIAPSGHGKSPAFANAIEPIKEKQRIFTKRSIEEHIKYKHELKKVANTKEPDPEKPLKSTIITNNTTIEALFFNFYRGQGSIYLASDEGAQFFNGYSFRGSMQKSATAADLCQYWSNQITTRERISDQIDIKPIENRRLSIHLMIQNEIIKKHLNDETLNNQGLWGRFLITKITEREEYFTISEEEREKAFKARAEYWNKLKKILDKEFKFKEGSRQELNPQTLRLGTNEEEGEYIKKEIRKIQLEKTQETENQYVEIKEFAHKTREHIIRLAATITIFEDIDAKHIKTKEINIAIKLYEFYLREQIRAFEEYTNDPIHEEILNKAERLKEKIIRDWDEEYISSFQIYENAMGGLRNKKATIEPIKILIEHGFLREEVEPRIVKGKLSKIAYKIMKKTK